VEPAPDELREEQAELEFDAMHLLARNERWLTVQRNRTHKRIDTLESQSERARRQRDAARERVERLRGRLAAKRQRVKELRTELRAERARPWSRLRQAVRRRRG
jgi:phage shock protein A